MRVLVVDDNEEIGGQIVENLDTVPDVRVLLVHDDDMASKLAKFEIPLDVALIDLRLSKKRSVLGEKHEGLAVCQRLRSAYPEAVVVGYSSLFETEDGNNGRIEQLFLDKGADSITKLSHLVYSAATELIVEFEDIRQLRNSGKLKRGNTTRIFIGSSTEGLPVAREIQSALDFDFTVQVWTDDVFGPSHAAIESLEQAARQYDFAIFVFTPDDKVLQRDSEESIPRDNVLFEAGLFMGSKGRSRTFLVKPRGVAVQVPSDLDGFNFVSYDSQKELEGALGKACNDIRKAINGIRSKEMT